MNYTLLSDWVKDRVEDMVAMGVPRAAAEDAMHYVEVAAINAESEARKEDQLLFLFANIGAGALGDRHGVKSHAIRARRRMILKKRTEAARTGLR